MIHKASRTILTRSLLLILLCTIGLLYGGDEANINVVAAGDVMLGSWLQELIKQQGWDYPFLGVDSVLAKGDLVFANLEAPFGEGGTAFEKSYTFQIPPDYVNVLLAGGINAVSLANNHILDFGPEVLQQTIETLKQNNIHFSGAGMDVFQAREPAIIHLDGKKIALASYSLTFPEEFWATDSSAGTCFPYESYFFNDIKKFKAENDVVIVSFHWSSELLTEPKEYQIELAHRTMDAGADLILGHHPHVIQGIEVYKNKLIAYSLGNFIFGSYSENARTSMILKINMGTKGIRNCRIYPINVFNKLVEFQPRLLQNSEKGDFLKQLMDLSVKLNKNKNIITNDGMIHIQDNLLEPLTLKPAN